MCVKGGVRQTVENNISISELQGEERGRDDSAKVLNFEEKNPYLEGTPNKLVSQLLTSVGYIGVHNDNKRGLNSTRITCFLAVIGKD